MYDVIIVGAGPCGLYSAYEFSILNPDLKVLLIEKGHNIYNRRCPILEKKIKKCPTNRKGYAGCYPACSITSGFGGSGAYSDGKFNITSEFGGWLSDYVDKDVVNDLINYVDEINLKHGATKNITDPTTQKVKEIEKIALSSGLKLLRAKVRHLGTEQNLEIMKSIYDYLDTKVDMIFKEDVDDIIVENNKVCGVTTVDNKTYLSKYVFIAAGREGASWLDNLALKHKLSVSNNQIDIGVRVETNDLIMEDINKYLYEAKLVYNTSVHTTVRTFCSNPSGHVVVENHNGIMLANGHSYFDPKLGSSNTNFALLVSHYFETKFQNPNQYGELVGRLANILSNGSVIVQRYGDLKRGLPTRILDIKKGFVNPTLKEAIPGDLGLILPYNTMKSIIEMIEALNNVTPGIANDHTLLYGVETKFYSARPSVSNVFETQINNLFLGGDGAGITRGLAQAGANGVLVAREICKREDIK